MRPTAMRSLVIAATVVLLSGAIAGCLGDEGGGDAFNDARPGSEVGTFRELERRPLDLPRIELEGPSIRRGGIAGRCLVGEETAVGALALKGIPGEAALGPGGSNVDLYRGPVYAALLAGPPRIVLLPNQPRIGGSRWRTVTTIWVSRPSYRGPVLVRGGRLDRPGELGFGSRPHPRPELRLPIGSWPQRGLTFRGDLRSTYGRRPVHPPEGWRVAGVPTRIEAPGCYAFQVDGLEFSYVLAFGVQLY